MSDTPSAPDTFSASVASLPQPADVPALNAELTANPLCVTLAEAFGQNDAVGGVTEFAAQGEHVLARVRFDERLTLKVPASLLRDKDGETLYSAPTVEASADDTGSEADGQETSDGQPQEPYEKENDMTTQTKAVARPPRNKAVTGPQNTTAVLETPEDKAVPVPDQNADFQSEAVPGPAESK